MRTASCLMILLLSTCAQAGKQKAQLHYADLAPERIIGSLGKHLGKIVEIRGTLIAGDKLKSKALSGRVLLEVTTVDGKKLTKKVILEFDVPMWAAIDKPEAGRKFKYIGYETGRMSGIPPEAFKHVPAVASTDLFFRVYFVVLKQV